MWHLSSYEEGRESDQSCNLKVEIEMGRMEVEHSKEATHGNSLLGGQGWRALVLSQLVQGYTTVLPVVHFPLAPKSSECDFPLYLISEW